MSELENIPKAPINSGQTTKFDVTFQASHKTTPFGMIITDQTLYVLKKKAIALKQPYYWERISKDTVQRVALIKLSTIPWWLLGTAFIVTGLWGILHAYLPMFMDSPDSPYHFKNVSFDYRKYAGLFFGVFIGGFFMPFVAKDRRRLIIETDQGTYTWKPTLIVSRKTRIQVKDMLEAILETCKEIGLKTEKDAITYFYEK